MSCTNPTLCFDTILNKLESETGLKFHAETETDTVNGSVSVLHTSDHKITVTIYDKNENPNQKHKTKLKKPSNIPTQKKCEDCLK